MCVLLLFTVMLILNDITAGDPCESKQTCRDCLREVSKCVWCEMEYYNKTRCIMESLASDGWCENNIINPKSSISVTKNVEFSSKPGGIVQIKPQESTIDIRPGDAIDFSFSFKPATDYPVDIYMLFDASVSMKIVKNDTATQSQYIYNIMRNISSNVQFGMGLFVDKNAFPYTQVINSTTYSFKNRLKLTDKYKDFEKAIHEAEFSDNNDPAGGTFDALAQAIVCKEEIGWRDNSRKIIVVMTNSIYHTIGDGRWAGIERPYDGRCYTENGAYTKEREFDYPSVGIINKLASDNEVIIIFLVDNQVLNIYEVLKNDLSGYSRVSAYNDGGNRKKTKSIGIILNTIYEEMTEHIKFKVNMNRSYENQFEISFNPNCINPKCFVKQHEEKNITGTIKLLKYLGVSNLEAEVRIEGIMEELNLKLNIINECDCNTNIINATACSGNGDRRCGVCVCNHDRYGENCECSASSVSKANATSSCVAPNATRVCSGRGSCDCGRCVCMNIYSGNYCECNRLSCPRDLNDAVCSNHGSCKCGNCTCSLGWSGKDCSCDESLAECLQDDKVCSGRGRCKCGGCQCPPSADWDARAADMFCQPMFHNAETGHSRQCLKLEACVISYLKNDPSYCHLINISSIKNLTAVKDGWSWHECQEIRVDIGCYTKFMYRYNDEDYTVDVYVQSDLNCAESYYMYGGGCLVGFILIGISTLCLWKYITYRRDRKEYKRFLEELNGPSLDSKNILYEEPTRSFINPTFKQNKSD